MSISGNSRSVLVGPSPVKILGSVLVAAPLAVAGLAILIKFMGFLGPFWLRYHSNTILLCIAAAAACFCGIAIFVAMLGGRPYVEIGPDGFVTRGVAGIRSRSWGDVEGDFVVVKGWFQSTIAYRLTDAFKELRRRAGSSTSPAGYDEAITFCGELRMPAEELAALLNQWKQGAPGTT
ncbi:MAG TPA: hypothetical protein VG269_27880 [Tepidisphaeraceae bacterium]|nr:hypothetical protein [Tepidisphaeraceae bacterium]